MNKLLTSLLLVIFAAALSACTPLKGATNSSASGSQQVSASSSKTGNKFRKHRRAQRRATHHIHRN